MRRFALLSIRTISARLRTPILVALSLVIASRGTAAQPDPWALDLSEDRAGVSLGTARTAWWSGRAQLSYRREGKGGALLAVEPLRRFDATDTTFIAAGWRQVGPWTAYAEAGGTPNADFHYRYSGQLEVFRRITGPWVGHAAYRHLAYSSQTVQLNSASLTREGGRTTLDSRLTLARNTTTDKNSLSVLARGHVDVRPGLRLGGGIAIGDRIFDVTSLAGDPVRGWVAFADARVGVGRGQFVGLHARVAEEGSTFHQTAVGLTYRRTF